jgi:RES domain
VRHIRRGGAYLRVADPSWRNPLSGEYARGRGGRWNSPGAFPVVYLNASLRLARALVRSRLESRGIRPEDVLPEAGPVLVHTTIPEDDYVNVVTEAGLRSIGLPASYPLDGRGRIVPHRVCQPIGQLAWSDGERGIACRRATLDAPGCGDEELAYFDRQPLIVDEVQSFADWFQ